jgi:hypothetical protein
MVNIDQYLGAWQFSTMRVGKDVVFVAFATKFIVQFS